MIAATFSVVRVLVRVPVDAPQTPHPDFHPEHLVYAFWRVEYTRETVRANQVLLSREFYRGYDARDSLTLGVRLPA